MLTPPVLLQYPFTRPTTPSWQRREAGRRERSSQPLPRVVQCLVQRSARGAETLGEYVDRHLVQGERDEDATLVRRQLLVDRPLDRREQLALLERGVRAGRAGERL